LQNLKAGRAKGEKEKRDTFLSGFIERKPKRFRDPREHTAPTRSNPSGSLKENGFSRGVKPLKRRNKAQ